MGQILEISKESVIVRRLYRPQDMPNMPLKEEMMVPIAKLFWSDQEEEILITKIVGKCTVLRLNNSSILERHWLENPRTFFFNSAYDPSLNTIVQLPKNIAKKALPPLVEWIPDKQSVRPLATLDMFCGCGGLSDGFRKAGIADVKWAVEFDPDLAEIYKKNHPETTMYCKNCNTILQDVFDWSHREDYPKKGEVEMIIGGPPCQGFSGMNRFNESEYSKFQNSVVVTYLSFVDYYRPTHFLLENVRFFSHAKKGLVIKLVLWSLMEMGYQCSYKILNCGNFGVPQSRHRTIVVAVRSGMSLPEYPAPVTYLKSSTSAPFRGITPLYTHKK